MAIIGSRLGRQAGGELRGVLDVEGVAEDGLVLRRDGTLVRLLEVGAVNALAAGGEESERVCGGMQRVLGRLAGGEALQLCVWASPLDVGEVAAGERFRSELAVGARRQAGSEETAAALGRLAAAQESSLRAAAGDGRGMVVRYVLACPWRPAASARFPQVGEAEWAAAVAECERRAYAVAGELESLGLSVVALDGGDVLALLRERFDPEGDREQLPPGFLFPGALGLRYDRAAERVLCDRQELARAVCGGDLDFSDRRVARMGCWVELVQHVSLAPEHTWVGWLMHAMQAPVPWTLSVHVQALDRLRERGAQKRRYKRIYGVHRGIEGRGRPVDADAAAREQEAADLVAELAQSAGAGIYKQSVYVSLRARESEVDGKRLGELCKELAGELAIATDARMLSGVFAQQRLWRSTLPLGLDVAGRSSRYVAVNVADTIAPAGSSCSSPEGLILGLAAPGRTLQRVDPFDSEHPNHLMLVNGVAGSGKTMASILLLSRAMAQGATGTIIDRAGHFEFLASLIPGAVCVELGRDAAAIDPWAVGDSALAGAEKVDYLLALHAQLLGEHHQARDTYGLSDLEANLLGLAIGEVYARCAATGERPRELLLAEQLERRYEQERREGSVGVAEALRDLALRLSNYTGDGPYAYLADRASEIPVDAPLVVFDTRSVPQAKAAAALLAICEHVQQRVQATRARHLAGDGPEHAWAGRSFLAIDEAWHLIERPATGRWFNEFVRRSRHMALWLVAISQQLSDFDCEHGHALLANATMRLFLRQQDGELARMRASLGLSEQAADAIAALRTVRGEHSLAYMVNGSRGEATVQIAPGPTEYWIASSDPARDEPLRRRALREAGGHAWRALELLADPGWHERARGELEQPA